MLKFKMAFRSVKRSLGQESSTIHGQNKNLNMFYDVLK